jgi:hypothetical protein
MASAEAWNLTFVCGDAMNSRFNWKSFVTLHCAGSDWRMPWGASDPGAGPPGVASDRIRSLPVEIPRNEPLRVQTFYDRPDIVSDEDLAAVLKQIQPPFDRKEMSPNHVEHALRTWGVDAIFQDPDIISGQEMLEFLTDHAKYMESWGEEIRPLLLERPAGIEVRWGTETGASYHHDTCFASVTEAGPRSIPPCTGRSGPMQRCMTLSSSRNSRFPARRTGVRMDRDGLRILDPADAGMDRRRRTALLLRLDRQTADAGLAAAMGVCSGTHRVYSLMVLIQLDDEYDILSTEIRGRGVRVLERSSGQHHRIPVRGGILALQLAGWGRRRRQSGRRTGVPPDHRHRASSGMAFDRPEGSASAG